MTERLVAFGMARLGTDAGGAACIEQRSLTAERLATAITSAMENPARMAAMADAARAQGRPDAVRRLADMVVRLTSGVAEAA